MSNKLSNFVLSGDFEEAKKYYQNTSFKSFSDNLISTAFDNQNISNYTLVVSLLLQEENAKLHELAFSLLAQPLCHTEGAYFASVYHARKAVELTDFKNVKYMENLLFLNIVPDKVVSDEEAREIAKKIHSLECKNELANELLNSNS
ncbi:hypothetical protein [Sporosarcina ureae]|uniref:hypothetical protein n=1 Tax=Sporosarcina ureae TaxID=1571 RepID=UPI0009DC7BA7|nr:hypothetical protein [Sporosarcina ureae]ARF17826.1 hypothetical protein SporoP17a_11420 [Sporosarcina ureae]